MGISRIFNVADLFPYFDSQEPLYPELSSSRSSFSQVGEIDADANSMAFLEISNKEKPKLYKPEMKSEMKKAGPKTKQGGPT